MNIWKFSIIYHKIKLDANMNNIVKYMYMYKCYHIVLLPVG